MSHNVNIFSSVSRDKTKRSSNFSTKEIQFLLQLVDKKKYIVESKKTDRATSEEKVKAWLEIEEEFNEVFDDYRPSKVLKTKYENLKKNIKRKLPANVSNSSLLKAMQCKEEMMDNEPISDCEYTDDDETLHSNASNVDTKPQPNHNNDDHNEVLNTTDEQFSFETLLLGDVQTSTKLQKSPKPQTVQTTEKRKPTIDIWDEVAHKKIKKLDLEMSLLSKEWTLRKTKLELELENIKTENKLKEDKLKLEIELLKEKLENRNCS